MKIDAKQLKKIGIGIVIFLLLIIHIRNSLVGEVVLVFEHEEGRPIFVSEDGRGDLANEVREIRGHTFNDWYAVLWNSAEGFFYNYGHALTRMDFAGVMSLVAPESQAMELLRERIAYHQENISEVRLVRAILRGIDVETGEVQMMLILNNGDGTENYELPVTIVFDDLMVVGLSDLF